MQKTQMTIGDTLGLGFMTFAFFLGAGNLIFPPLAGYLAGENMFLAMFGFLITAVGLPLAGLVAVAKAQGNVMRMLPLAAATLLSVAIYIIIGPAFAAPRAGLVAFEIGAEPFISDLTSTIQILGLTLNKAQLFYTIIFFGFTMLLSLFPSKLLDNIGKVITPIMIFLLAGLGISVIFLASGTIGTPVKDYATFPLTKGIIEGYNTMDMLASLMFGVLIVDLLRKKGVTDGALQTTYLIRAAIIAATGLALVYISLFFLGVTAGDLAEGAKTGGVVLTNYVTKNFGFTGVVLLSAVVTLACLTTVVGLVSACAEYFNELLPRVSYKIFVVIFSLACATVANVGLAQLIKISIPVLMTIYPVAITLVLVTFLNKYFKNPRFSHRISLSVALLFGITDGIKVIAKYALENVETSALAANFVEFANKLVPIMSKFPLYDEGMSWVIPTLIVIILSMIVCPKPAENLEGKAI